MRAVNLIPRDTRRSGVSPALGRLGAAHALIGLLVVALALVAVYVLTSNTISQRKSQLATLQQQVAQVQAQAARLTTYAHFEQLAQQRAATVRQIAATRFDWHAALSDLSRVVPANTSLQSLVASAAPGSAVASTASGAGGSLRGAINAPALELKGCTGTQDEVAQLISRLRLINHVTRVTLEDSVKQSGAQSGAGVASTSSGSPVPGGCTANGPSFDMVVFFQPLSGIAGTGSGTGAGQQVSTATTGATK